MTVVEHYLEHDDVIRYLTSEYEELNVLCEKAYNGNVYKHLLIKNYDEFDNIESGCLVVYYNDPPKFEVKSQFSSNDF